MLLIFEGPDTSSTVAGAGAGLFCLSFFCESVFLLSGFSVACLVLGAATGAVSDGVAGVEVGAGLVVAATVGCGAGAAVWA